MSRIGKLPIDLPAEVETKIDSNIITIKGPKGELSQRFDDSIGVVIEDNKIIVERNSDLKVHRSLHGLTRSLISNMVEGVTKGFQKNLEIEGVGYRAQKQGNKLILNIGYSHPVEIEEEEGIEIEVPATNRIIVKGVDKQKVGAMAAKIRGAREPEPYKGKGIRYEGERIIRKEGKTG